MKAKTKTNLVTEFIDDTSDQLSSMALKIGLFTMGTAAILGAVQTADRSKIERLAVLPTVPVLVPAGADLGNGSTLRREREESAPHYISYSETERTPSRSGKH